MAMQVNEVMAGSDTARFLSRPTGFAARWLWLSGVAFIALVPAALIGFSSAGPAGVTAAGTAAAVCWFAASVALCLAALVQGPQAALATLVFGLVFRMGFPLAMFAWLRRFSELTDAGFVWQLAFFYLLMLAVETWLTLPDLSQRTSASTPATTLRAARGAT